MEPMKRARVRRGSIVILVGIAGSSLLLLASGAVSKEAGQDRAKQKEPITYAKQVSRILQDKCQTCHHPGTAAPFSLLTYKDAVNWSGTIREVISEKRMPPWHADPRFGHFENDRRLSKDDTSTLLAWLDNGMERGEDKDLPPTRSYTDGWVIGKPDIVFELPGEQTVPATGGVAYQYFVTPTNFKENVWVQAPEARPGNRGVVHH